jgi:hypothetical protein
MKKEDFMQIVRSKAKETLTEQDLNFFAGIGEAVETAFNAESVERNKQIKAITEKLGTVDEGETFSEIIRNLSKAITDLENKTKRSFTSDERFKLKSLLEAKKDDIQRARKGGNPWEIEFRAKRAASALMTTSTVLTGAQAVNNVNVFEDMDITVIEYPKNFILDGINSRQVAKVPQTVARKEQLAESDGRIGATSEGNAKPLTDKLFTWKYDTRKKYAGRIEMTEEVEIDFDQLVLQIISMFEDDVLRAYQNGVLADIVAWADTYVSTGLDGTIANPTVHTVIGAGQLHIRNFNYEPDVIFISPTDVAKMVYTQDNNGNQMFIPEAFQFAGLTPFVTNQITAGKILIGTKRTVKEQHGNLIIRKGVHGDQFIENESTIVGEIFSVLSLPTQSQTSWLYMDVATVQGLLQKV